MNEQGQPCWCGGGSFRECFRVSVPDWPEGRWRQCAACGVYELQPRLTRDQIARAYDSAYYGATRRKFFPVISWLFAEEQRRRARWIRHRIPQTGRVLDVGCGNGGLLYWLQKAGCRVEGTEWSAASAARVPSDWGIPVSVGDLLELDLAESHYDAVVLWHVLEHLPHPGPTLVKIQRLLKPNGVLILSVPNWDSWQCQRYLQDWFHVDPPRHFYGFTPTSLQRWLERSGFQWTPVGTFSLAQGTYGVVQSHLNAWGFPRDRAYAVLKGTSGSVPPRQRWLDLIRLGLLTPFGLAYAMGEALAGRGAVCTGTARKLAGAATSRTGSAPVVEKAMA